MHLVVQFLLLRVVVGQYLQPVDLEPVVAPAGLAGLAVLVDLVLVLAVLDLVAALVAPQRVAVSVVVLVAVAAAAVASAVVLAAVPVVDLEALVAPVDLVDLLVHVAVPVDVGAHHSDVPDASVVIWKSSSRPRCRCISPRMLQCQKARSLLSAALPLET